MLTDEWTLACLYNDCGSRIHSVFGLRQVANFKVKILKDIRNYSYFYGNLLGYLRLSYRK